MPLSVSQLVGYDDIRILSIGSRGGRGFRKHIEEFTLRTQAHKNVII